MSNDREIDSPYYPGEWKDYWKQTALTAQADAKILKTEYDELKRQIEGIKKIIRAEPRATELEAKIWAYLKDLK